MTLTSSMTSGASPPVAMTVTESGSSGASSAAIRRTSALDLARETEDDAGLQRLDRVLADHMIGPGELHLEQLGGAAGQGVHGDLDPRRKRAPDELAAGADRVEVGRGAEVHDERRAAVEVDGGDAYS